MWEKITCWVTCPACGLGEGLSAQKGAARAGSSAPRGDTHVSAPPSPAASIQNLPRPQLGFLPALSDVRARERTSVSLANGQRHSDQLATRRLWHSPWAADNAPVQRPPRPQYLYWDITACIWKASSMAWSIETLLTPINTRSSLQNVYPDQLISFRRLFSPLKTDL